MIINKANWGWVLLSPVQAWASLANSTKPCSQLHIKTNTKIRGAAPSYMKNNQNCLGSSPGSPSKNVPPFQKNFNCKLTPNNHFYYEKENVCKKKARHQNREIFRNWPSISLLIQALTS